MITQPRLCRSDTTAGASVSTAPSAETWGAWGTLKSWMSEGRNMTFDLVGCAAHSKRGSERE